MSALSSAYKAVTASAVLSSLTACMPGSFGPILGPPDPAPAPTRQTSVYVIQNPATFGSGNGSILQFPADSTGSVSPTATITGPTNTSFNGLAIGGGGGIYTSYSGPGNPGAIVEYSAGSSGNPQPQRTITANATTGVTAVDGLAASAFGEVFAAEDYGGVQAFGTIATGSEAPTRWILGAYEKGGGLSTIGTANSIAEDSSGNLYVVNEGYAGGQPVLVFGPSATGNVAPLYSIGGPLTGITVGSVTAIATDPTGNVFVTTSSATGSGSTQVYSGTILEFAAGAKGNVAPTRTITGPSTQLHVLSGIALDAAGNIYVVSASSPYSGINIAPTILKFAATTSGDVAPVSTFTSPAWTNPDNSRSIAVY